MMKFIMGRWAPAFLLLLLMAMTPQGKALDLRRSGSSSNKPGIVTVVVVVMVVSATAAVPRIAGGQDATPGQFPWLVSLRLTNTDDTWHLCGGILVTSEWVLLAAHCLDSEKPEWLAVVSGEHRMGVDEGTEQLRNVDFFIQHPNYIYYMKPYVNDVGLVHVTSPFILDTYTQLTPLRVANSPLPATCTEAGWGAESEAIRDSSVLQFVDVPIQPIEYCESAYLSPHDPNALCAGSMAGGAGFCRGDNGGGLQCWDEASSQYVVSGILSWREGCSLPNKPAVYMDVAPYMTWIMSVISPQ